MASAERSITILHPGNVVFTKVMLQQVPSLHQRPAHPPWVGSLFVLNITNLIIIPAIDANGVDI